MAKDLERFQFLLGKLKTVPRIPLLVSFRIAFQFLLGRLKTGLAMMASAFFG